MEKLYDNPKITTRHLYNGFTKEIDYDEVKNNDLLFEPYTPMNYNPQTAEALPF